MTPDKFFADKGIVTEFPSKPRAEMASPPCSAIPVLSSAEFVKGFCAPDYCLDGIIQRGFLYSLCGPTGSGKTAITLRLLASTALGLPLAGREVIQGRCLMLVGENPDDIRARWMALSEQMGFDDGAINVHFIPGIFPIPDLVTAVRQYSEKIGDLAQIVVDTSAAYFGGEDENDNKQAGDHARQVRTLTGLPGRPCVIVNCHPTKNAAADNLLPRGGGAFIAEMDGNLCCKSTDKVVEMHWQGKFRGPDFAPVPFELLTVTSPRLVDSRGRPMPTVIARPISEFEQLAMENTAEKELEKMLSVMLEAPGASISGLATQLGWLGTTGNPLKSKVHRLLKTLQEQKLATQELKTWKLTNAGEKAAKRL